MKLMSRYEDNHFDLAIVDPPYGIGENNEQYKSRNINRIDNRNGKPVVIKHKGYKKKEWDSKSPNKKYFKELKRISKNQIIFGANHFIENIPDANSSCWIVWDKDNTGDFADSELAYSSFITAVRNFKWRWNGMLQQDMKNKEIRIHPTQKPVKLYEWLLMNYAKEGDKILDTHLGSGSIAIACHNLKFDFTACELDKEYFDAAMKRIEQHKAQLRLL
jgi:site-specific DNA-methyltransferase (adenine-specific)